MGRLNWISDEYPLGNSALRRVFERYAEDAVTEEQVERVLAPVRRMILAGCFSGGGFFSSPSR